MRPERKNELLKIAADKPITGTVTQKVFNAAWAMIKNYTNLAAALEQATEEEQKELYESVTSDACELYNMKQVAESTAEKRLAEDLSIAITNYITRRASDSRKD